MRSLRWRITLLATAVLLGVLVVAAISIVNVVDRQVRNDLAEQNQETLTDIAIQIEEGTSPFLIDLPLASDGTEFAIADAEGRPVNSSVLGAAFSGVVLFEDTGFGELPPGFDVGSVVEVPASELPEEAFEAVGFDPTNPDDIPPGLEPFFVEPVDLQEVLVAEAEWTFNEIAVAAPSGAEFLVQSFTPLVVVDRSVDQVQTVLWFVIPILGIIFGGLVWATVGRALKPVDRMRARAANISTATLHERVEEPGTNDEIDRLAITLNSMLDRLDDGVRRQQQFLSDASHELRGPLTVMLGEAQLAAGSGDPEALERANAAVVAHGERMAVLIDDLLQLARSGELEVQRTEVDLDDLVREEALLQPTAVDTAAVAPVRMTGDPAALGRLVRNLLDNAARFSAGRVALTCGMDQESGHALIIVDDDGPGIPEDQRETVFERFARLDESRTRSTGGTGLGLAIAKAIVDAHDGSIAIGTSPFGGARMQVLLPIS